MKLNKTILIVLGVVIIVGLALTLIIGNIFISYALVPAGGAQERGLAEKPLQDSQATARVAEARQVEAEKVSSFLQATEDHVDTFQIQSFDGTLLEGQVFKQGQASKRWALLHPGYNATMDTLHGQAAHYYNQGFHVLIVSPRGIGPSQGEYITMGIKEHQDLLCWLDALLDEDPQAQILVHGESMGAATALAASGQDSFPEEVFALVADCGYSDIWDIFASELKARFNLPAFPFMHMAAAVAIGRVGINLFSQSSIKDQVIHSHTPTLFIHGQADDFVPYDMGLENFNSHPGPKKFLAFDEAAHAENNLYNPERYYGEIDAFILAHNPQE